MQSRVGSEEAAWVQSKGVEGEGAQGAEQGCGGRRQPGYRAGMQAGVQLMGAGRGAGRSPTLGVTARAVPSWV